MKRYIYGITALLMAMLAASALTACVDDNEPFEGFEAGSDCFTLVVNVPMEAYSRADDTSRATEAEINNNEFKVTKLHLYFYKTEGHDDAISEPAYEYEWTGEFNDGGEHTVTVPLPSTAIKDGGLFGATGTTCKVYAVANVDETVLPDGPQTINQLKATAVTSAFDQTKVQDFFAMDGQAEVTIDRTTRKATGEITLYRAAAKITLAVNLPETIEVTDVIYNQDGTTKPGDKHTYKSNPGSMHVWISNGVKNSKLNTDPDDASFTVAADDLYSNAMETTTGNGTGFNDKGTPEYKYIQDVPFYSYPYKWDKDSPEGNSYLTLVVSWTSVPKDGTETATTIPTYYRIPIQPDACKIVRNMHYDIRVTIGRLGSVKPQEPTDMKVDWNYAIPWNDNTQAVDIKQVRYLLLNNNYYDSTITNSDGSTTDVYAFEMNNTTDIEIPVGTSHDVEIAEVTMSWIDYSINPPETRTLTLTTDGLNKYCDLAQYNESNKNSFVAGIEMDNNTSKLLLKRYMLHLKGGGQEWVEPRYEWQYVNGRLQRVEVEPGYWKDVPTEITQKAALNSYTFDIKLQHADDKTQTAMVHITQYPPIYITAEETPEPTYNYSYRFVNGYDENLDRDNRPNNIGYVSTSGSGNFYLGTIGDKGNQTNKNTYVITISRLGSLDQYDDDNDYVIADPRSRSINNDLSSDNTSTNAASWSRSFVPKEGGSSRKLTYYYPADPSDSKTNYIAPKLRVASQYGVTQTVNEIGARRRCASYQENGRPAGRWRLPTKAEIKYIAKLSCEGYIPFLFGTGGDQADYWCASGAINVINSSNPTVEDATGNSHFVRCVYDEWYWGDGVLEDKTKFTWGDRLRTISGN